MLDHLSPGLVRPAWVRPALLGLAVVVLAAACRDDGDDVDSTASTETATDQDGETGGHNGETGDDELSLPEEIADAVLTSEDVPGWEATVQPVEDEYFDQLDCPEAEPMLDTVDVAARVELSIDHGPWEGMGGGIFQDVLSLTDEAAARAAFDAFDGPAVCPRGDDPGRVDLETAGEEPIDLADADLGDDATGTRVLLEEGPFQEMVDSTDHIVFRRDNVVVSILAFMPLAEEVDLVALASAVDDRLSG